MPRERALYSTNETDRAGDENEGTVSAFSIDRSDGKLALLNTVRSGGAGPTYASVHPGGRFLLVANYFGGSVAVLPIESDGRLGGAPRTLRNRPARLVRPRRQMLRAAARHQRT